MTTYIVAVPKAGRNYTVDTATIPAISLAYIQDYGARQSLVDSTAGVKRENFNSDAEFTAEAQKRADNRFRQIKNGELGPGGGRVIVDPMVVLAAKMGLTVEKLEAVIAAGRTVVDESDDEAEAA
jgi:hypothetical protein